MLHAYYQISPQQNQCKTLDFPPPFLFQCLLLDICSLKTTSCCSTRSSSSWVRHHLFLKKEKKKRNKSNCCTQATLRQRHSAGCWTENDHCLVSVLWTNNNIVLFSPLSFLSSISWCTAVTHSRLTNSRNYWRVQITWWIPLAHFQHSSEKWWCLPSLQCWCWMWGTTETKQKIIHHCEDFTFSN